MTTVLLELILRRNRPPVPTVMQGLIALLGRRPAASALRARTVPPQPQSVLRVDQASTPPQVEVHPAQIARMANSKLPPDKMTVPIA